MQKSVFHASVHLGKVVEVSEAELRDVDLHRVDDGEAAVPVLLRDHHRVTALWWLGDDITGCREAREEEVRGGRDYTRIQGWILKEQFVTTTTERKGFNNELLFCQNLVVKLTETSAAVDRMKNKWSDFKNKRKLRESITGLKDVPADVTTDVHVRESYSRNGLMCFLTVSVKVLPALWIRKKIMATFWEERTLLLSAPESQ